MQYKGERKYYFKFSKSKDIVFKVQILNKNGSYSNLVESNSALVFPKAILAQYAIWHKIQDFKEDEAFLASGLGWDSSR